MILPMMAMLAIMLLLMAIMAMVAVLIHRSCDADDGNVNDDTQLIVPMAMMAIQMA